MAGLDPPQEGETGAVLLEGGGHPDEGVIVPGHFVEDAIQEGRYPGAEGLDAVGKGPVGITVEQDVLEVTPRIGRALAEQVAGEDPLAEHRLVARLGDGGVELRTGEVGEAEV